jgi:poly(3-hydroxybutyrate) depolymerase
MLKPHRLSKAVLSLSLALGIATHALALSGPPAEPPPQPQKPPPLPALSANPKTLTVSGLSSGAFMAVQFHVAHSAEVKGAGIMAGGPYYCARNTATRAVSICMNTPYADPFMMSLESNLEAEKQGNAKTIDDPYNLEKSRVWLWSGGKDSTVNARVVYQTRSFYRQWVPASRLTYEQVADAGHAIVTPEAVDGNTCDRTASPYLNRCIVCDSTAPAHCTDYDAPGRMLAFLFNRPLQPKAAELSAEVQAFDQTEFFPKDHDSFLSMDDTGFVYIPETCKKGGCDLHVVFHGCKQSYETLNTTFVKEAGYNRWADSNKLIVLYPQIKKTLNNPESCWDWWGYTGSNYHLKSAPQIQAVQAMIERLIRQ